ncbi:MAG: peptidoglycan editing factor PgeF [Syntrophales bacterium]|jgi:YfiH family protein|nr:peptidoglycan editing factor PgeF [Syntrophales bacterium]MDY0043322.1 peptidoglycan editing factor PgeF [Syntrophales bacterium]
MPFDICFEIVKNGDARIITSRDLAMYDFLCHGFGTRSVNHKQNFCKKDFPYAPERLFTATQVHGNKVVVIDNTSQKKPICCDGMVTMNSQIALAVRTADCIPILILDPVKKIIGAVHAGWRGTVLGITAKAIEVLVREFYSDPADIKAAIGPSIGPCCYEVDNSVFEAVTDEKLKKEIFSKSRNRGRLMMDLRKANLIQMKERGMMEANIVIVPLCTACHNDLFFSYRKEGSKAGRQLNFIMLS